MTFIPIIDLKNINTHDIYQGCLKSGFLFIKNSDINDKEIQNISKTFFESTSENEKQKHKIVNDNHGFVDINVERLDTTIEQQDLKQAFNFHVKSTFIDKDKPLPNLFNEEFDKLRKFTFDCHNLCLELLKHFSLILNLPVDYFADRHSITDHHSTTLRLLYYPKITNEFNNTFKSNLRAGKHSDYGSLTLLFQNDAMSGLQILNPDNEKWIDVIPPPNEDVILCNIGDLLEFWTGGLFKSTIHRVLKPETSAKERLSIAYFLHPNDDCQIKSLNNNNLNTYIKGILLENRFTAKEYLNQRLNATYKP